MIKQLLHRLAAYGFAGAFLAWPSLAAATNIVYTPVNPSFGGNPLNGPVLLNSANAQNSHKDPSAANGGYTTPSALDTFNQRLQSMILDRVATSITGSIFDANGKLKTGTVDTSGFSIAIVDLGNGVLKITTTDKTTGASTTFQVSTAP
jgi:curli production assembly/transport component CsgF